MEWHTLSDLSQIDFLINESKIQTVAIFKHSTRCSISSSVKDRLERNHSPELNSVKFYYLDLINHRDISNALSEMFSVHHESPQLLLLKDGKCIYNASHYDISAKVLLSHI